MRKLYVNIEHVKILYGGANTLGEAITAIDSAVEKFSNQTVYIYNMLSKYSETEKGIAYTSLVETVSNMTDELSLIADELNLFQHDIVRLIEKIKRYENDWSPTITVRNLEIDSIIVQTNEEIVEFHRDEMTTVISNLLNYIDEINHTSEELILKKDSLHDVWLDEQYSQIYSPYIDDVCNLIKFSENVLKDYVEELRVRIKNFE